MIIYITGPVTGDAENKAIFFNIKNILREHGHQSVNPYDLIKDFNSLDFNSDSFLKEILINILSVDAVFTLADWHSDKASSIIVDLARKVNIEVNHFTKLKDFILCQQ